MQPSLSLPDVRQTVTLTLPAIDRKTRLVRLGTILLMALATSQFAQSANRIDLTNAVAPWGLTALPQTAAGLGAKASATLVLVSDISNFGAAATPACTPGPQSPALSACAALR